MACIWNEVLGNDGYLYFLDQQTRYIWKKVILLSGISYCLHCKSPTKFTKYGPKQGTCMEKASKSEITVHFNSARQEFWAFISHFQII